MDNIASTEQQINNIKTIAQKVMENAPSNLMRVTFDPAYAGGNPKIITPGNSAASDDSRKVVLCPGCSPIFPSGDGIAGQVANRGDAVILGSLVDLPAGNNNHGNHILLPWNPETTTTGTVGSNNQVKFWRFEVTRSIKVASLSFEIAAAVGSSNAGVSIYSSDGLNKLIDSGAIGSGTTGVKTATLGTSVLLTKGHYLLAYTVTDTGVTFRAVALASSLNNLINVGTVHRGQAGNSSSGGVNPSSLGTITTSSTTAVPVVLLNS
jgi:hypothetical protein